MTAWRRCSNWHANGKTTTKELIAAVLGEKYNVLYTQGNLNNHIGVPKTLLTLRPEHNIAVVEMGANHPGEIRTLVNIAEPDCGLITNIGKAHLLGFGSLEGVLHTKGELYDFLRTKEDSVVFIDDGNKLLSSIADGLRLVRYGTTGTPGLCAGGEVVTCDPCCASAGATPTAPGARWTPISSAHTTSSTCSPPPAWASTSG